MSKPKKADTIIAFDFGEKRIGVAVGHALSGTAHGIDCIQTRDGKLPADRMDEIFSQWQPGVVVVGEPKVRNKPHFMGLRNLKLFGKWLSGRYGLKVHYVDETLSTEEARHRLASASRKHSTRQKTQLRNMIAAEIILQAYLSSRNSGALKSASPAHPQEAS